ncbi:hypothetical protein QF032_001379 [Streptomyces achromogenes]|uniref:hypothetical protein n=1 Tax=Streptomyces achromogenes TaxID=67255 RepID=UPI0027881A2A|nr:hypothetical protein [Streptomyces achromogenes]MDQ0829535.1 hypothetical protein [Streptomyces achromogenes]
MAETIYVRGEGGAVIAMDLPLPEGIQERLDRGAIQRVNADGSPHYAAPARAPAPAAAVPQGSALTQGIVPRPGARANKDDWVLWAMAVHAVPEADAEAMTKTQLQELPEHPAPAARPGDGRPDESADKSAWIDYTVKAGRMSREDAEAYTKDDLIALFA